MVYVVNAIVQRELGQVRSLILHPRVYPISIVHPLEHVGSKLLSAGHVATISRMRRQNAVNFYNIARVN